MTLLPFLILGAATLLFVAALAFDAHLWRRRHHDHLIPGPPHSPR